MRNINELEFVRTFDFRHIPRYLFEQVEELDSVEIDRIYNFGAMFASSPLTLLYVLVDMDYKIKGVLWAAIDIIEAIIFIRVLSLDKEYQSPTNGILLKVGDFLVNLKTGPELKKEIHFLTLHSDISTEHKAIGLKRSKRTLMEWKDNREPNGKNNKNSTKRDSTPAINKPIK